MQNSAMSVTKFVLSVTSLNILIYHYPLLAFSLKQLDIASLNGVLTLLTVFVLVFMISSSILLALALFTPKLTKLVSIVLALVNSVALYFMVTFQVILDRSMIGNILNTQSSESSSYFHPTLLIYFVLLGVLPSVLIWRAQLQPIKRIKILLHLIGIVVLSMLWIYSNSSTWLWFDKHGKMLGGQVMPWSYVFNTVRYQSRLNKQQKNHRLLPDAQFENKDKAVVMLIIGETARRQNFSLYGYERETNPRLKQTSIIALNNPVSCSTYTTASVACILSHQEGGESDYEPLPSYLQRQGVEVIWHTSNWGEPRIKVSSYQTRNDLRKQCVGEKCQHDELLLTGLKEKIAASKKQKILIILHTKGSHGPSYFTRYPKRFEQFTPVCKTVKLSDCSSQELVNAYDNSLLYTDYFLKQSVDLLKGLAIPSTLLYLSDHGESLGEFGLYLHGTPMSLAPEVQTNIPFLLWMSESFVQQKGLNKKLFKQAKAHSQEQIFHSVLGAFGIKSEVYQAEKDIYNVAAN